MQNKLEQLATAEQMIDEGVNPDDIIQMYLPADPPQTEPPKQIDVEESDSEGELKDIRVAMKQLGGETRLAKDLFQDLEDATLD